MTGLGKRLAEERKRLGLSQSAFADLIGVSFSSQRRYEDGRSSPDTLYLDSLRKHGVDVEYVISGRAKQSAKGYNSDTLVEFGLAIAKLYQISPEELNGLAHSVSEAMKGVEEPDSMEMWAIEKRLTSYEAAFFVHTSEFFSNRLKSIQAIGDDAALDPLLLAKVISGVESALACGQKCLEPRKKAQAMVMLYRAFKASGKVDQAMIEEAVKLAGD